MFSGGIEKNIGLKRVATSTVIVAWLIGLIVTRTITFQLFRWYFLERKVPIYFFKVNNAKTRAISEICSKSTIKTPGRRLFLYPLKMSENPKFSDVFRGERNRRRSGVFIVNFEQDFTNCSVVSIVDFTQVSTSSVLHVITYVFLSHK